MARINLIEKNVSGSTLNTYVVDCKSAGIGWSNSLDAKPYANSLTLGVSEVQKNGFDNPLYTLQGVIISERIASSTASFPETSTLFYDELVRFSKLPTDGTSNYLVLSVDYGISSSVPLIDSAEATSGVKVVIKSFNMSIGLDKQYGDDQRIMSGSIVLQESS